MACIFKLSCKSCSKWHLRSLHYPLTSPFSCITSKFIFYLTCIRQLFIIKGEQHFLRVKMKFLLSIVHHPSSSVSSLFVFYSPQTLVPCTIRLNYWPPFCLTLWNAVLPLSSGMLPPLSSLDVRVKNLSSRASLCHICAAHIKSFFLFNIWKVWPYTCIVNLGELNFSDAINLSQLLEFWSYF